MKNMINRKLFILAAIAAISSCGLQVRDNPITTSQGLSNKAPDTKAEKVFTVGGVTIGAVIDPLTMPISYQGYLPQVVITINGEDYPILVDGTFTFEQKFHKGDAYTVALVQTPLPIPTNVLNPYQYLFCDLQNQSGVIDNADVTNIVVQCHIDD
jgi:hypothetical protein